MSNEEPNSAVPHPRDLFLAIRHWDAAEVARLLARGANPNWKNRRGDETALSYAAYVSTADVVRVLLSYGATDDGEMPLEGAVSWNRTDGNPDTGAIARLLLAHRPDAIRESSDQGRAALMTAIEAGDAATIQVFLDYGADANSQNPLGNTPLSVALSCNNPEIVEILQNAGAH